MSAYNVYVYCAGNPVKYSDNSGQFIITTALIIGVGIGVLGGIIGDIYANKKGYTGVDKTLCVLAGFTVGFTGGYLLGPVVAGATGFMGLSVSACGVETVTAFGGAVATSCFVEGTLISAIDGLIEIENIREGDFVLSYDPDTGDITYNQVLEVCENKTNELIHLYVTNEEIITTPSHPFYVKEKGFVAAGELTLKDELLDSKGHKLNIQSIEKEICTEPINVYNFSVEDYHTYFVGNSNILVHNKCGIDDNYGISIDNLKWSNTVFNEFDKRFYQKSKLLIQEIIANNKPISDPQGSNALRWDVRGKYGNSEGIFELVIDPVTNTVWHFLFRSK